MFALGKLFVFGIALIAAASGADQFCPESIEIAPCVCVSTDGRPSISCALIADEDQLETIFSAAFPVTEVDEFTLTESGITSLSRNVFWDVSFEFVKLESNYLSSVGNDVFNNSLDTLRRLHVKNGPITGSSFPFLDLDKYEDLIEVQFWDNFIDYYPQIPSDTLVLVFIVNNLIEVLPNLAFVSTPAIESLDLAGNQITSIEIEAFLGVPLLYALSLSNNQLTEIDPRTFNSLSDLKYLALNNNEMSTIDSGTFRLLDGLQSLDLSYNNLKALNRTLFGTAESLQTLKFQFNDIGEIDSGMFNSCPSLGLIDFSNNNLTRISTGTFNGLTKTSIYLANNIINYIEADAFGDIASSAIHLENNRLSDIFEFWARPLLEKNNQVFVTGNPFGCGCEIVWIFEDPTLQANLYGQCPDGTYLANLDPADFAICSRASSAH